MSRCPWVNKTAHLRLSAAVDEVQRLNSLPHDREHGPSYIFLCKSGKVWHYHLGRRPVPATPKMINRLALKLTGKEVHHV